MPNQPVNHIGTEVEFSNIHKELKKFWGEDATRTRASLMNLCVYSEEQGSLEINSQKLNDLTQENACRAILVEFVSDANENIFKTWINAHCHYSGGKKAVCSEQVAFQIGGGRRGRLRNLVFSQVDSDLPLNFWWRGELSDRFEPRLYSIIDRFIYDSSEWTEPYSAYHKLVEASKEVRPRMILHDLEWARSYGIRNTFARLFDNVGLAENIGQIHQVEIVANRKHQVAASLLIAWLATQAGWDCQSSQIKNSSEFTFVNQSGSAVNCSILFEADCEPIKKLEVKMGENNCILIKRDLGQDFLEEHLILGAWEANQVAPADSNNCAKLVGDTMSRNAKNILFLKVLPTLEKMLQA